MPTPKVLHIAVNSRRRFETTPYTIRYIADEWMRAGGEVRVSDRPDAAIDADLVVAHIDLTVVPPPWRAALARHPRVLNRRLVDISKRRVSGNIVQGPGDWDGPVMVKTDRNHGGWPELDAMAERGLAAKVAARLLRHAPWRLTGLLPPRGYPVYAHPREVPALVWRNPRLVVERFRTERRGPHYCVRQHLCLGERSVDILQTGTKPIVKAPDIVGREVLDGAPPALMAWKRAFGFDYGKIDYALCDGELVVYDVNRTPCYVEPGFSGELGRALAPGLDALLAVAPSGPRADQREATSARGPVSAPLGSGAAGLPIQ